jgi:hypothetical protein
MIVRFAHGTTCDRFAHRPHAWAAHFARMREMGLNAVRADLDAFDLGGSAAV